MVDFVKLLSQSLSAWRSSHQIILFMDVCKPHLMHSVLRTCARENVWCCFIPAKLTWCLQPCDTHVFAHLKHWLAILCQERRAEVAGGKARWKDVLVSVIRCVDSCLLGRSWAYAFAGNGLTGSQTSVSCRVWRELEWEGELTAPATLPTLSQFESLWSENLTIPFGLLFAHCTRASTDVFRGAPGPTAASCETKSGVSFGMWHGRLRSSSGSRFPPVAAPWAVTPCLAMVATSDSATHVLQPHRWRPAPLRRARPCSQPDRRRM